jgi:hypothetical membrane protein
VDYDRNKNIYGEATWFEFDNYRISYVGEVSESTNWFYNFTVLILPFIAVGFVLMNNQENRRDR